MIGFRDLIDQSIIFIGRNYKTNFKIIIRPLNYENIIIPVIYISITVDRPSKGGKGSIGVIILKLPRVKKKMFYKRDLLYGSAKRILKINIQNWSTVLGKK
jgi:hypothetical protein